VCHLREIFVERRTKQGSYDQYIYLIECSIKSCQPISISVITAKNISVFGKKLPRLCTGVRNRKSRRLENICIKVA
jgi:hypothetical protein